MVRSGFLSLAVVLVLNTHTDAVDHVSLDIVEDRGRTYHHLTIGVEAADFARPGAWHGRDLAYETDDGGQFEIYLRVDRFPVAAPNCADYLIVRMPWTDNRSLNADRKVRRKAALLDRLIATREQKIDRTVIVLQLEPYVTAEASEPYGVTLTECTIFFRHAAGSYWP